MRITSVAEATTETPKAIDQETRNAQLVPRNGPVQALGQLAGIPIAALVQGRLAAGLACMATVTESRHHTININPST